MKTKKENKMKKLILILTVLLSINTFAEEAAKLPPANNQPVEVKPVVFGDIKHDIEIYNFGYQVCTVTKTQMSCVILPQATPTPAPIKKK